MVVSSISMPTFKSAASVPSHTPAVPGGVAAVADCFVLSFRAIAKGSKFEWRSRYWSFLLKLDPARPSPTIQAQPGPNVGPFHWENRRLRVPELKRLFTFPDDFVLAVNASMPGEALRARNFSDDEIELTFEGDFRFAGQAFELQLPLEGPDLTEDDRLKLPPEIRLASYEPTLGATEPTRPETPLRDTIHFTNSPTEPNQASEIGKEIASADRVDALIAFETYRRTRRLPRLKDTFAVGTPEDEDAERRVELDRSKRRFR